MLRRLLCPSSRGRSEYGTVCAAKASFFGGWGGNKSNTTNSNDTNAANSNSSGSGSGSGFPGFPPGMDAQKFQAMQQLFESQPPEKREQMMKQALEFQKMMSKVPGLGKLTHRNQEMMEALLNMKQNEPKQGPGTFSGTSAAANRRNMREMFVPPTTNSNTTTTNSTANTAASSSSASASASAYTSTTNRPSSGSSSTSSKGPTLDELKKVNLGPEIEALFEELRTVRNTKNSYRDKYHTADKELQRVQKEWAELKQTESSLRDKIKRSERDVMLLTSENMTLQESSKKVKELTAETARLKQQLQQAEKKLEATKTAGTPSYDAVSQQLQAKENSLRSLQRKLNRARDRDPMLKFSLACNDVGRLCESDNSGRDPGKMHVDEGLRALGKAFEESLSRAWHTVAVEDNQRAAMVYLDVAKRFVSARVPHANLDAAITVEGDAAAATEDFKRAEFAVTAAAEDANRLLITAPSTADVLDEPGPYGYALAARLAPAEGSRYKVVAVHPIVTPELLENTKRCEVTYETARASGPGGQATNVTETQVYAKLAIDGVAAYTAEAQESRSAMSNKEAALQKLKAARRVQYNETLSRQQRPEEVLKTLATEAASQGGFEVPSGMEAGVREGITKGRHSLMEESFVLLLKRLERKETSSSSAN